MKKIKLEKGITLIALIITIIILLILAVVTIGSIKNSNIITYAQNAATDYNKEKVKEESVISGYETLIDESIPKEDSKLKFLAFVQNTAQTTDATIGDYKDIFAIKDAIKEEYQGAYITITYYGIILPNNSQMRRIQ